MRLAPLTDVSADSWDRSISRFNTEIFYHRSPWLGLLEDMGRGRALRFGILDGETTIGYFAALLLKKGPFRILGSPLSTSMTEYLGPVVDEGFDIEKFLKALDGYCDKHRIHQVEIGSPLLKPHLMREHGYETSEWMTFRIPLSTSEEEMWTNLKGKCRNRIRKGEKNGLIVEDTDDPSFVELHYRQICEVFSRQNVAPPFSLADLRALFSRLKPAGLAYTLQVRHQKTNEIIATGIFPHGRRFAYSLSTASWARSRSLYPNELLYWTALKLAGQESLETLSVGDNYRTPESGGKFKNKFNGRYEPVYRFVKSYSPAAKYARELYRALGRLRRTGFRKATSN